MNRVVLVLKKGGDFTIKDVFLLASNLKKHSKEGVKVTCITDWVKTTTVLKDVDLMPMPNKWSGWWSKFNLFDPALMHLRPFLYLDLDTAIVGDYSSLFKITDKFITLSDFYRPGRLASGVMFIPENSEKVSTIWRIWNHKTDSIVTKFRGDQEFIGSLVAPDMFWQDTVFCISSFKPKTGWLVELPKDISVVCFHGKPRIWEAAKRVEWVNKYVNDEQYR